MPVRTSAVCRAWLPRPGPQVHVGPGQAELAKENLRHPFVVVLPGVHDPLIVTKRASARITGAAFMKFGLAPSTCVMGARIASFPFTWTRYRRHRDDVLLPAGQPRWPRWPRWPRPSLHCTWRARALRPAPSRSPGSPSPCASGTACPWCTRCAGSGRTPGCPVARTRERRREQRALPAKPGHRDPVHAGRRPGGDARRGHAGGDRGPRRRRGEDPGGLPNAVSAEFLRPLPDGTTLRAALGIDPDDYVVGVVSSLVPHEGIGTLLEATAILRARSMQARALIVGDAPDVPPCSAGQPTSAWLERPSSPAASPRQKYANSMRSSIFSSFRARQIGSVSS